MKIKFFFGCIFPEKKESNKKFSTICLLNKQTLEIDCVHVYLYDFDLSNGFNVPFELDLDTLKEILEDINKFYVTNKGNNDG